MSEQHEGEQQPGEPKEEPVSSSTTPLSTVLKLIDDWEQDYFAPASFPTHIKAHIDQAVGQLRERIRGLAP